MAPKNLFGSPDADDTTVVDDPGDDMPAPMSPLDALAAHHAQEIGVVTHADLSALITAFRQHISQMLA
jgi:hypothetical protein